MPLFRLPFHALLYAPLALLFLCAGAAHAVTAGSVAYIQGEVMIRAADGVIRPAGRGLQIQSGETVETRDGRAQLAMADGAYISLQPNTALAFDAYQLGSANEPERGFMNLLRGGLRTVTGLIGRAQRANYQIRTPTATIGIRGTEFLALIGDDGLRVRVAGGLVAVCNDGGCLDVAPGQTGFAPSATRQPVLTGSAPILPPNPAPQYQLAGFQEGSQRAADGASSLLAGQSIGNSGGNSGGNSSNNNNSSTPSFQTAPIAGGNGSVSLTYAINNGAYHGATFGVSNLTFNSTPGAMTSFGTGPDVVAGTIAEANADGIIAWGRWTSGTVNLTPGGTATSLQYIAFNSTQNAAVPVVQIYTSFASTAPVLTSSANGAILATGLSNSVTGTLNVNFPGSSGGTVAYSLQVPIAGQTFSLVGNANQFSTTGFLGTTSVITSTGSGCSTTCTGVIPFADALQGSLAGTGSTRAGATYGFSTSLGGNVSGAVVFK